jgi:uncharacterized membrane protein
MFGWLKKKSILSAEDNKRIVEAIKSCEQLTSGEIRIYMESKNPLVSTLERATEIFTNLQMHTTKQRNAVLLYVAVKDREVALFGDEGIHQQVGTAFWNNQIAQMISHFKENNLTDGIVKCIAEVGSVLVEKFPYNSSEDKNELPNDIIFGK